MLTITLYKLCVLIVNLYFWLYCNFVLVLCIYFQCTVTVYVLSVYIGDDTADTEPEFQYIPDTHHISTTLPPGGDALDASLLLLSEGLESGAALAQFDVSPVVIRTNDV